MLYYKFLSPSYKDGAISYSAPVPYVGSSDSRSDSFKLGDESYDGKESDSKIQGGLGQLVDGVKGYEEKKENNIRRSLGSVIGGENGLLNCPYVGGTKRKVDFDGRR